MKFFTKENILSFLLITAILIPIALIKLGAFPIRLWDESMFSVNSYEMLQRNEFIIPYFDGKMNLWNSKPPLLLWLQMASIKLFGFNELAVRLPSAIAVALCILFLFFFLKKHTNLIFAWLTILILITSQGFFTIHTGRTADADALLTLILTAANLLFIDSIIQNKISNKRLLLFFILITIGFLCKSFAALLFSIGYLIILIIKKENIFLKSGFWFGILTLVITAISFIIVRNNLQPGYIGFILTVDIGRMTNEIEQHKEPFKYYIENLSLYNFRFWFFLSLLGLIMLLYKNMEEKLRLILFYSSILLTTYFIIISISVTKLAWYTMPIYPFLSILAAIPIYHLLQMLDIKKHTQIAIIILLFAYPYNYVFGLSQSNPYTTYETINESSEHYIFNEINQNKYTDNSYVLHSGFQGGLKFYQYKLKEKQLTLFITEDLTFPSNSVVIVSRDSLKQKLKSKYNCLLIDSTINTCKYKILSTFK